MNKLLLLLCIILCTGCGGGGSSSINPGITPAPSFTTFQGYVYGPSVSSLRTERQNGLKMQEGLIIIDEVSQAPSGYMPVVKCLVTLGGGNSTSTDNRGWFVFNGITPCNYGQNNTVILDPSGSTSHSGFGSVAIETIIPSDNTPPSDFSEILIKPQNLVIPVGGFFLYHAYGISGNGQVFEVPPEQVEWFVNSNEGNIGSITPYGLFEATGTGTGRVLAKIKSEEKTATGTVQVVPEGPVSTIKGQVYRLSSGVTKEGIPDIQLFVSTRDPEVVPAKPPQSISDNVSTGSIPGNYYDMGTITDREGYYEFPRVPAGETLTLTAVDPVNGFVKFIENITLQEGEVKVIDIDFSDSQNYFQGSGLITYEDGTFIFTSYEQIVPLPEGTPIPLREDTVEASPPVVSTTIPAVTEEKYILTGIEKFPEIKDKIMKEQGKDFEAFVTGKISDSQGWKSLIIETVELIPEPSIDWPGKVKYENGSFIFHVNFSTPDGPLPSDTGTNSSEPSVTPPSPGEEIYLLSGMDKFPDVKDKIMKEPGKEFSVFISGTISNKDTISVEKIEIITDGVNIYQGSGSVKYTNLEGGTFIFNEAIPAIPVIDEGGGTVPTPSDRSFALTGLDKFPDVRNKLINEPGKDFYCYISGEICNEPSIYMMDTIKIYKIELFLYETVKQ